MANVAVGFLVENLMQLLGDNVESGRMEVQRYCNVRGMLRAAACDVRSFCDGDGDERAAATAMCELRAA
ncbi:hypothetical protein KY285_007877 [Solanum tuberosum]|nr:hypothetical protein KY285_007877 [Solanum tuberosum]